VQRKLLMLLLVNAFVQAVVAIAFSYISSSQQRSTSKITNIIPNAIHQTVAP